MKKVKYPNLNDYDLSAYKELKGDVLYRINGGGAMTQEDQAKMAEAAKNGDKETQEKILEKYKEDEKPAVTPTTAPTTNTTPPATNTTPNTGNTAAPVNTSPEKPKQSTASGSGSDSGSGSGSGADSGGGGGSGNANNYNGSACSIGNNSQRNKPVSEEEGYYQAGLAHVEDYKNAAMNSLGIKGKEVPVVSAQNVTLTGRNLTGRGFPSSTDGFRPVEVKSGSPGSLARKGYPSTTEGYPNAYNTIEKKPLMGEDIYSEYYIRKKLPEQYQEAAIRAMHEEEKRGLYGSPTDSKRMTTPVGDPTELQDCHTGVDVGALKKDENNKPIKGDPIYATADGKVLKNKITKSNSTLVELSLPYTNDTAVYQHANFIVDVGDEVKRGQVIGYMDNKGPDWMTTHLHYEIRHNGIYALNKDGDLIDPTLLVDPTLHMPGTYYFDKALGTK